MDEEIIHAYNGEQSTYCGLNSLVGSTLLQDRVNCLNCLNELKIEWQEQVDSFNGNPLKNASIGLAKTIEQIKTLELGSLIEEGK